MMPLSWAGRIAARLRGLPTRPRGARGAGYDWERVAEKALTEQGFRILARNFRTRAGEIDFVAEEKGLLCFIEVKGRSDDAFGAPSEAVTAEKQRRIYRAAEVYLARRRGRRPTCRFDVVSILGKDGDERVIEILRDAFRGPVGRRHPR
jgi:putative endonuclease